MPLKSRRRHAEAASEGQDSALACWAGRWEGYCWDRHWMEEMVVVDAVEDAVVAAEADKFYFLPPTINRSTSYTAF